MALREGDAPAHPSSTGRTHTDGVDVRLVACERLPAHAVPDVPQFDRGVAGPRDKSALIGGQGQTHDVAGVAGEHRGLLTCLDVPQCAGDENRKDRSAQKKKSPRVRPVWTSLALTTWCLLNS